MNMSVEEVKITLLHCGKTNRCEGCPCQNDGMRCINNAINNAFSAILELEQHIAELKKCIADMNPEGR